MDSNETFWRPDSWTDAVCQRRDLHSTQDEDQYDKLWSTSQESIGGKKYIFWRNSKKLNTLGKLKISGKNVEMIFQKVKYPRNGLCFKVTYHNDL